MRPSLAGFDRANMAPSSSQRAWAAAGGGAALALLAAAALLTRPGPGSPVLALPLALLAAAAGLHRPLGGRTLGLGAMALPAAILLLGPAAAGAVAGAAGLVRDLLARLLPGERSARSAGTAVQAALAAVRLALAAAAAGLAWRAVAGPGASALAPAAAGAGAYLVALGAAQLLVPEPGAGRRPLLAPLVLDLAGWAWGALAARSAAVLGWTTGIALLGGAALLTLEASRADGGRARAERRLRGLRRVADAGQRVAARDLHGGGVAEQVLLECRRVVPWRCASFELLGPEGSRTWSAGADGTVAEGPAEPPAAPPALPGFHRRARWRIVERELEVDGVPVARLRLWCDPRQVEPAEAELLETLLPQMAASVQRALLTREAQQDPLTGLAARRVLETQLERTFRRAYHGGGPMAVVMVDLDHFKAINDSRGHAAGDQTLAAVARLVEVHRRPGDLCCRYGGEEFTLLLDGADGATALRVAERMRAAVEGFELEVEGKPIPLTLSAGVASFPELFARSGAELLALADAALYEAKRQGRNLCLLDLGRGRFRTPDGRELEAERPAAAPALPKFFA